MSHDLTLLPAHRLAALIRERTVSSVEVVRSHLSRITDVNPLLHAVVQLRAERALADAALADAAVQRGGDTGPLHGVPFTVKDWIETDDLPCAAGIDARREYVPKRDATVVRRMREAGAILLGKTKPGLDDVVYPRANHPHDDTRTPGGSSAGEAALIAAHGSPLGLGSDSGGSLRWPAHCCGIATIKPTTGRVPNTGHFPRISPMLDPRTVIGPMARSVRDLEIALRIIAGPDGRDPSTMPVAFGDAASVEIAGMRVACYVDMPGARPSADVRATTLAAARTLADAGAVVTAATPPRLDESLPLTLTYWRRHEPVSFGPWQAERPTSLTGDELQRSLFEWDRFRREMLAFMQDYDAILCPVAEGGAPLHDDPVNGQTYVYMLPYSLAGLPVAVVPAGLSASGLPLGVQVVARAWDEHVALALAGLLEGGLGVGPADQAADPEKKGLPERGEPFS